MSTLPLPQAFALAVQHHKAGRFKEAEPLYRQILAAQPNHADALHFLGVLAHQTGRHELAAQLIQQAIVLKPGNSAAFSNLGEACRALRRFDEAIAGYTRALELNPRSAETHYNLGNALGQQSQFAAAAIAHRRALALKPHFPEASLNLGNMLREQGELEEAMAAYRNALELRPNYADAQDNLCLALAEQGRLDDAITGYRRILENRPDDGSARFSLAMLLLRRGDFEHGWSLYESRWAAFRQAERRLAQPMWEGGPLNGRRVLIHAEQGFGDSIQFIRYAPLVAQRGGRVIVECQAGLKTLLAGGEGISEIVEHGESLPAFDLHCPMLSLPLVFGTRIETIPAAIPYLRADGPKAVGWRQRLDEETDSAVERKSATRRPLQVGLIWAGNARPHQRDANLIDRNRSMRLSQFAPLAAVPGVVFVSLQKGPPAAQAKTPPEGMTLLDWTDELHDFSDTAALIEALDLVISVDTAGAHLAGALGKPVWVLNRFASCWRWLLERTDSPWYPTLRLFRQTVRGDWTPVVAEVRERLELLAKTPPGRMGPLAE